LTIFLRIIKKTYVSVDFRSKIIKIGMFFNGICDALKLKMFEQKIL
jgi:hypothetical protein